MKNNLLFGREILYSIQNRDGAEFIRDLLKHNLLASLIPELEECKGVPGGIKHGEEVLEHLIFSLEWAEKELYPIDVCLSALLHDIGKPQTRKVSSEGMVSFWGHELVGATIAYNLCKKWEFPEGLTSSIVSLVRHHMYKFTEETSDKAIKHWMFKLGPLGWRKVINLRAADRRGNLAKADRPAFTTEMLILLEKCQNLEIGYVYKKDLNLNQGIEENIKKLPEEQHEGVYLNLLNLVTEKPERNNSDWISSYINRIHIP